MQVDGHQILILLTGILGGGVGVTLLAQLLKKTFKMKTNAVVHTMVIFVSIIISVAQYIVQLKTKLPPDFLGLSGPAIYGVSQIVFRYARYASDALAKIEAYNQSQIAHVDLPKATIDGAVDAMNEVAAANGDF